MNHTEKQMSTRREFLKNTGLASTTAAILPSLASSAFAAASPNETIGVGCIGLGTRGGDLINAVVQIPRIKVTAVCDVYKPHRQKGVQRSLNPDVKDYLDYHDLLQDKSVDAVVIATPDHWHTAIVLDAVNAGKDIYCEKGWARTIAEVKVMRDAIKQKGTVFQLGHHARQATCALQAKELIAEGALGPITLIRTGRFGNKPLGQNIWRWYGYYNKWDRPNPVQVAKEVDWDRWLGPAPRIPWNERHFWHWRCYWPYGTGQAGDLLSHELDFVQYLMGYGVPDTCLCTGLNALLKDDREVPDTWNAVYQFEQKGCTVTFDASMNTTASQPVEICGKEARLRFDAIAHDANSFTINREPFNQKSATPEGYQSGKTPSQPSHIADWVSCIRSRAKPKCNVDEAFIETATFVMSVESYKQKRMVRWDPVKEEIV
jgi:predicted dehydrogenase